MNKILKKYYIAMAIYLIPFLTVFTLCTVKTNYQAIAPAIVTPIQQRFKIANGYKMGDLHSLNVFAPTNINLFQKIICDSFFEFDSQEISKTQSHMTEAMWYKAGVIQKQQSEESSIINAYKAASINNSNISIDYDYLGVIIRYTTASDNIFKLGDIITHVNNELVESLDDINDISYEGKFPAGTTFTYIRDDLSNTITIKESDYVRVLVYDKYKINETIPKVTIIPTTSTGPSAGFIQTLSIYNMLTETDITKGKKIVATGTIESDGSIGAIGGMKQKTYSAFHANAEYLIVPKENYEEALVMYNTLKNKERMILKTFESFNEVIAWLQE